jgi:hypothetical protein
MANPTHVSQSDATTGSAKGDSLPGNFGRCVKSFEAEASLLSRGFKTALFIQQFKSGLLRADSAKGLRGFQRQG